MATEQSKPRQHKVDITPWQLKTWTSVRESLESLDKFLTTLDSEKSDEVINWLNPNLKLYYSNLYSNKYIFKTPNIYSKNYYWNPPILYSGTTTTYTSYATPIQPIYTKVYYPS